MTKMTAPKHMVVYADDDPDDIELVEDAFRRFANNVEVTTFRDGSSILSYLKNMKESDPHPCLIILDINMPLLNGKDVLVRLRQMDRYQSVPIVLFTTSSMTIDKTFAQTYKAGFVTKPLGFEQMEKITHKFIDHCTQETQSHLRDAG